jgi:hypothetical protein
MQSVTEDDKGRSRPPAFHIDPSSVLRPDYGADFAFLSVQVDHEKIGGQRLYSQKIPLASDHLAFIDFRTGEGARFSVGLSVRINERPADLLHREPS